LIRRRHADFTRIDRSVPTDVEQSSSVLMSAPQAAPWGGYVELWRLEREGKLAA
jgi:hypothetical protein